MITLDNTMSWIEVGKNRREVRRLNDMAQVLWDVEYTHEYFNPFLRPWMWVNFNRKIGGCFQCSQFLGVDVGSFGTKQKKAGAMRTQFDNIFKQCGNEKNIYPQKW